MEEKALITSFPPSATTDVESAAVQSQDLRRKKTPKTRSIHRSPHSVPRRNNHNSRANKIRSPNYKLYKIKIENLVINNSTYSSSFSMDLETEIAFRNRNFGPYKFEFGYLTFSYIGTRVGDAVVESSKVKMYSSKIVNLKLKINAESVKENSNLRKDIGNGRLMLKVDSELRGQVGLMKVFKHDRNVKLNCSLIIDLAQNLVQDLSCS